MWFVNNQAVEKCLLGILVAPYAGQKNNNSRLAIFVIENVSYSLKKNIRNVLNRVPGFKLLLAQVVLGPNSWV